MQSTVEVHVAYVRQQRLQEAESDRLRALAKQRSRAEQAVSHSLKQGKDQP
ncbi:MAG: hypothetical protein JOZ81_03865 [Chloroflexi bacterium]|nr:hypothetical protein [Chloroflexota bacterium]